MIPVLADAIDRDDRPRRPRILVIDDEAAVRRSIARVLTREGYSVTSAESAEEAFELIEGSDVPFDLVISDIVMTGMSGVVFAKRLRASARRTRIMLISGFPGSHLGDSALGADGFDLLQKPFTPTQLAARVREHILDVGP